MEPKSKIIITISRQLGCGGAYVGQNLAKRLGILYADREIIGKAAGSLSLLEKDLESRDERLRTFWQSFIQSYAFSAPDVYVSPVIGPTDRDLFVAESEVIRHIAREGSAVIIGRCSSFILRDLPKLLRVFLHADNAFRGERIQKLYGLPAEAAEKMLAHSDKERALYNRTFTGFDWTDARHYDLAFDSGRIGLDRIVELIAKSAETA